MRYRPLRFGSSGGHHPCVMPVNAIYLFDLTSVCYSVIITVLFFLILSVEIASCTQLFSDYLV